MMVNDAPSSGDACGAEAANPDAPAIPGAAPGKQLSPEAERALLEAEARRQAAAPADLPREYDGRGGEEPTRYGDWERKGLAVDF